jgi:Acetyltransferase (isoleucine patch superfamily)
MAYQNEKVEASLIKKFRNKILLSVGLRIPMNSLRVWSLRRCDFHIGEKVYIGGKLIVASILGNPDCKLIIGNRVAIGPRVTLLLSSDPNWSSLSKQFKPVRGIITIGDDAWLGAGVIVMPNVTIGACSVIGAGAVVTHDIPPFSVAVGVPAKVIKTIDETL